MSFTNREPVVLLAALTSSSLALLYTPIDAVSKLAFVNNLLYLGEVLIRFYLISITFFDPRFGLHDAILQICWDK